MDHNGIDVHKRESPIYILADRLGLDLPAASTHDLLLPNFPTTGAVERAAAGIVLLDELPGGSGGGKSWAAM